MDEQHNADSELLEITYSRDECQQSEELAKFGLESEALTNTVKTEVLLMKQQRLNTYL